MRLLLDPTALPLLGLAFRTDHSVEVEWGFSEPVRLRVCALLGVNSALLATLMWLASSTALPRDRDESTASGSFQVERPGKLPEALPLPSVRWELLQP